MAEPADAPRRLLTRIAPAPRTALREDHGAASPRAGLMAGAVVVRGPLSAE